MTIMDSDGKKISFGFSKLTKKSNLIPTTRAKEEKKVDLIDCLEGHQIKIKGAIEEIVKGPLIIPIKHNGNDLTDRIKEATFKNRTIKTEVKSEIIDDRPNSELTIDELAARELIRDAKNRDTFKETAKIFSLPIVEDLPIVEAVSEASLEDYENVPIQEYGLAMLRGMGWKEGMGIGKKQSKLEKPFEPVLRPKGLGLGANKLVDTKEQNEVVDDKGEKLILIKGAYGKIIGGANKGNYCKVQGFDDEAGRIIVKTSKNIILTLNEFLIIPVTEKEYSMGSKIINNDKYEQFKDQSESEAVSKDYTQKSDVKYDQKHVTQNLEEKPSHSRSSSESDTDSGEVKKNASSKSNSSYRSRSSKKKKHREKSKSYNHRRCNESDVESECEKSRKPMKKNKKRDRSRSREKKYRDSKHRSRNSNSSDEYQSKKSGRSRK